VNTQERPLERTYAAVAAVVCWITLGLQLYLSLTLAATNNVTPAQATVNFFSYFTVLINLVAAIAFTSRLLAPESKLYRLFTDPHIATAIAAYITIVAAVYSAVLRAVWEPTGLQRVVDIALHDVIPVAYIVFWLLFVRHGPGVRWSEPVRWLVVPLVYIAYTLVRGALTGWYPYDFLDIPAIGFNSVARVAVGLSVAFWAVGLCFVALNRRLSKSHRP
jgi:hypothetical protein